MKRLLVRLVSVVLVIGGLALASASVPCWTSLYRCAATRSEGNV